jgi:hypothetical protein
MQVERIDDMQVGDFIQLPQGKWHTNLAAKAMYATAQAKMAAHTGDDPAPQYSIEHEPANNSRLDRIR